MEKENSIKVLIQVAELSQKAGILNLKDAVVVSNAVDFLNNELNNPKQEDKDENKKVNK